MGLYKKLQPTEKAIKKDIERMHRVRGQRLWQKRWDRIQKDKLKAKMADQEMRIRNAQARKSMLDALKAAQKTFAANRAQRRRDFRRKMVDKFGRHVLRQRLLRRREQTSTERNESLYSSSTLGEPNATVSAVIGTASQNSGKDSATGYGWAKLLTDDEAVCTSSDAHHTKNSGTDPVDSKQTVDKQPQLVRQRLKTMASREIVVSPSSGTATRKLSKPPQPSAFLRRLESRTSKAAERRQRRRSMSGPVGSGKIPGRPQVQRSWSMESSRRPNSAFRGGGQRRLRKTASATSLHSQPLLRCESEPKIFHFMQPTMSQYINVRGSVSRLLFV